MCPAHKIAEVAQCIWELETVWSRWSAECRDGHRYDKEPWETHGSWKALQEPQRVCALIGGFPGTTEEIYIRQKQKKFMSERSS